MNEFKKAEQLGREKFQQGLKKNGIKNYKFTTNQYDPIDCIIWNKGKKILIEIKNRDEKYENYPTHMMELHKYRDMMKMPADKRYYVCIFGNTFYWYNLNDIDVQPELMYGAKTTAIDTGKVLKQVLFIPTNKAKITKL